eukprot:758947-Amphidinium_carterae.1
MKTKPSGESAGFYMRLSDVLQSGPVVAFDEGLRPSSRYFGPAMGLARSKAQKHQPTGRNVKAASSSSGSPPRGGAFVSFYASRYQQRVLDLAREAVEVYLRMSNSATSVPWGVRV